MIPDSRTYVHLNCQTSTEVSGPEFSALSDPLIGMERTFCTGCDGMFPLDEFAWADTKERIPDYYARHAGQVSAFGRAVGSRTGLFLVTGLGAIVLGVLVGVVVGFAVPEFVIKPATIRSAFGVSDTRMLR